jgi:formamidopyrimidine-DNA glycosylase
VRQVLGESLAAGGTSFDALYVSAEGVAGDFERDLAVYGRENEPCRRCGTPIRRDHFMNRSTFYCPKCQPRPRSAKP